MIKLLAGAFDFLTSPFCIKERPEFFVPLLESFKL